MNTKSVQLWRGTNHLHDFTCHLLLVPLSLTVNNIASLNPSNSYEESLCPRNLEYPRYNFQNTGKSGRKNNGWMLHSSLEYRMKYLWKEFQRQSLELG
jgi:hypothetical protein